MIFWAKVCEGVDGVAEEGLNIPSKEGVFARLSVAERINAEPKLEQVGVQLPHVGERIAHYVNQGYEAITF